MIRVNPDLYLSRPTSKDIPCFVRYLKEKSISDHTIFIPYPYRKKHAREFIALISKRKKKFGRLMDFAIRNRNGRLIGMISFHGKYPKLKRDEIGFWLARSYWNRSIMTQVLRRFEELGFRKYGYKRLHMLIFGFNKRSMRVAEKCGFTLTRSIRRAYFKNGRWISGKLFSKISAL